MEFNRGQTVEAISRLEPTRRLAVCATCAERLIPFYEAYWAAEGRGPSIFRTALDLIWRQLEGGSSYQTSQIDELRQEARARVPDEDEVPPEHPYAQDAAIAVTYVIETWQTAEPQSAALCLEQAYNVADNYVVNKIVPDGPITEAMEADIQQHAVVQAELARQAHNLELCGSTTERDWPSVLNRMKAEALHTPVVPSV